MSRKQRGKGGPRAPQQGGAQQQKQQQGGGWAPLRDAIRRDVEQAVGALAFSERLHARLETQRRLFHDFPRAVEQLRSGAMERLAAALSRLYEGSQGFDVQRFLRDLPLALAQLAAAEKPAANAEQKPAEAPAAAEGGTAAPAEAPAPAEPARPEVSPRVELRAKLLAASPELARAAATYRRNVATIRRAALPRRSPGPWRADREVLEESRRAVEFVHKLYDTYAEAWSDQRLPANLFEEAAAETDRFLAWTQLDRYTELAVLASTQQPRPARPGQQIVKPPEDKAAPAAAEEAQPVTEASPGAVVAEEKREEPQTDATPQEPQAEPAAS